MPDDDREELSIEELEEAAGGVGEPAPNTNACLGGNCNCGSSTN